MNRLMYLKLLLLLSIFYNDVVGEKILTILTVPSRSHLLWYTKYVEALLARGHVVTYVGVDRIKSSNQNLRQIVAENLKKDLFSDDYLLEYGDMGPVEAALALDKWDYMICDYFKRTDTFQEFLKVVKTEKFDLVVNDLSTGFFLLGAAGLQKNVPLVGLTPFGVPSWSMDILKNPILYPSHPHFFLPYGEEMTFFERVCNFLFYAFYWGTRTLYMIEQNKHAKDAFGESIEPLEKILERMNIIMVNSIEGVDFPYPRVPGLIPIGGMHIDRSKELPQDLRSYLDGAKEGVLYFSLGTNVRISALKKEKLDVILEAFKQIAPIKVLMKWETDESLQVPSNVKMAKWIPQNDVLAHPNVRLFFTHSGLLSTQEAIYHGVPVLGMPFALDQHANSRKCAEKGIAEILEYSSLSTEDILEKIRKLINNPKYKENVKRLSVLFRDSLNEPRHRAVFWTEYAIRHMGAPHLSVLARKLTWYQNSQLDVYLLLLFILLNILYNAYKVLRFVARKLRKEQIKTKTN